ncbi:uncharacterized protein [Eurosta solidaginis]|uniref:uncharacterized protein n=1 Tax=Eurosta solidaginis TaxID=178769 RepID=UPI0035307159
MSDKEKKVLKILTMEAQSNPLCLFQYTSFDNEYLNQFKKRRAMNIRKMQLLRKQYFMLLVASQNLSWQSRSYWTRARSQSFWEVDCQVNGDEFFKSNFRMKRSVFIELCDNLRVLEKKDTPLRKAISLHKRVAIALYALGSSAEYRTIGNMFGVGKSTVCEIVLEFCTQTWKQLSLTYMPSFPLTREKVSELVQGFEAIGFPQCMGAIDGCHIEIHPRSEDATDYYNYKGWYSTILLALVDARYRFIYINVGSPGRCNDSQIFESSTLKTQLEKCPYLDEMRTPVSGVDVPIFIIGDSAFRFSKTLMKPYAFQVSQNEDEKNFNYSLSKVRRVVENAFGHVKARFRRIGKGIDNQIQNANIIIKACCVLHNFLNERNDSINEKWISALQIVERNRQYPHQEISANDRQNNAEIIRKSLATLFTERVAVDVDGVGDSQSLEGTADS